ncbi:LuxR C-terminal-related transcriptional regulator [Gudongella sp. SC589]|jgi:DNA-binding NarL/FixJ family response regulator|uniref:LuxR C-terminal-related transcriptional regulator n=1 Tax=Gudongella sp. SC589 TaxID=3385990 RepID=UPI003904840E
MKRKTIKVMLADAQLLCLYGLKHILDSQEFIKVVASASNKLEILDRGLATEPDILIMDPQQKDNDGFETIRLLKERGFKGKIILLLENICNERYMEASKINIEGYVLKTASPEKLLYSIKEVNRGMQYIDEEVKRELQYSDECLKISRIENEKVDSLSQREYDILKLVASGLSNRSIADQLFISEKTVKNHLTQIFRKLEVSDRVQATLFAIRSGIR